MQWKRAIIAPIPKVTSPSLAADYRPISITPVMSRIMEKIVVRKYIYPALYLPLRHNQDSATELDFSDQFAFRPTGSITAAVISLFHIINDLLTNSFVRVFALDFSKAFDTVKHDSVLFKLLLLDLPDEVYNWIRDFFQGHSHCTKFNGIVSDFLEIFASVFQGSGIGPASFIVTAADLQPKNQGNKISKYADDTYLIVPASKSSTSQDEMSHIADWSRANNLQLNQAKSKEMVFVASHNKPILPDPIQGISRVDTLKMLGVLINSRLTATDHVTETIKACSRSLYALRILRSQGLMEDALHTVFKATTQAKLLYCSPAWSGFCLASDRKRLESFLQCSKRLGYCSHELFRIADETLFTRILANKQHVLNALMPLRIKHGHNTRKRHHDRALIKKSTTLNDRNFIIRSLYNNVY